MPNIAETLFRLQGMSPVVPTASTSVSLDIPLLWVPSTESSAGCAPSPTPQVCERLFESLNDFKESLNSLEASQVVSQQRPRSGESLP